MLPGLNLPASLLCLLGELRPCFTAPGFATFCGLVARLAVLLVVPPGADLEVAVDDSVFRRSGRKVHGAGWQHDGSAQSLRKLSYGNCFVTAGIVVKLPFCARAICPSVSAHRMLLPPQLRQAAGPATWPAGAGTRRAGHLARCRPLAPNVY